MTTSNSTVAPRVWADIDLGAVLSNARTVAAASGTRLLPMVKADGYGVGAVPVAKALEALDPWGYGVASVEEGEELRSAGIARPVVVFSPLRPGWIPRYLSAQLRPTIGDHAALRDWISASEHPFHVELDTGLSRAGFRWSDSTAMTQLLGVLSSHPPEGVFTHFHSSDDAPATVDQQWDRFMSVVQRMQHRPPLLHAANSGAALRDRKYSADLVRPGIFLYGGEAGGRSPSPVVQLKSVVIATRRIEAGEPVSYGATWTSPVPVTIATLAIGYADGLHRALASRGRIELNDRLLPIAGRITMDMTMLAVPDDLEVAPGDVATVFGSRVSLDSQAGAAGTISYELLTSMGRRVERRYSIG